MKEPLLFLAAYIIGSIPTALWVGRSFYGIDIRNFGSGNSGATNAFRILGAKWGCFIFLVDISKGLLATSLILFLPQPLYLEKTTWMIIFGLFSVIGHIFPIFANFKGGKGVATMLGVIISTQPLAALYCTAIFLLVFFFTKIVSAGSILAGIGFAILVLFIFNSDEKIYRLFSILVAFVAIATHQKNIARMWKGTENKVRLFNKKNNLN